MGIGGGLLVFGLLTWAAAWIAHEPFWHPGDAFGVVRDPPRWISLLTGAKARLFVTSLVVELWGLAISVVGLLIIFGVVQRPQTVTSAFIVLVGGGAIVLAAASWIAIVGWLRTRRRTRRKEYP